MPPSDSMVEIVLMLRNVRQFISGTDQAAKGVGKLGKGAEKAGKQAGLGWKQVAKWGGAAGLLYGATKFLKSAVSTTEELGKGSLALSRSTGLDIKTSAEWATVLKARGQQVKPFQMGLIKLSREAEKARKGTALQVTTLKALGKQYRDVEQGGGKKAPAALAKLSKQMDATTLRGQKSRAAFTRLGVSMDAVKRGDVQTILLQAADGFKRIQRPTERAALAQQLFSRQGRELAPILFKGSDAIREQLGLASKYVKFLPKNAKEVAQLVQDQREMNMAYTGLQVSVGTALLPVINQLAGALLSITRIIAPLTQNTLLLKIALVAITVAFVAYKVAVIISTLATNVFNASLLVTLGWVALIIAALVLLAAGAYLIVKHWGWIKAKAMDVWGWIKKNWPLLLGILLGPFGLAVGEIIQHWDAIKKGVKSLADFIVRQFQRVVDFIKSIPGKIGDPFKKVGGGALSLIHKVPGLQHGGTVHRPGLAVVGEAGPELVHLPAAAAVQPLPAVAGGFGGELVLTTNVMLDRRVLAQAVGRYTADKLARR